MCADDALIAEHGHDFEDVVFNAPATLRALAVVLLTLRRGQLGLDRDAARDGVTVKVDAQLDHFQLKAPADAVLAVLHLLDHDLPIAVLVTQHLDLDVGRGLQA